MSDATPTRWDQNRRRTKGAHGALVPRCSRCGRARVLDPCRDCATPTEAAHYPPLPEEASAR